MINEKKTGSIDVSGVSKSYGNTEVLRTVSLRIEPGSFVTLLGPSGCGKTTLLRLIAGFIEPSQGEIRINGIGMAGVATQNRPIGMVFQNLALFPHLTVYENVAYGLRLRKRPMAEIEQRVTRFIELVGLSGLQERRINQLSGGQKQRVALARSLVLEPSILLLDEPLSALDLQLKKQLQVELKRIQKSLGTTFIYVTHDQEEATVMSDTIVVMDKGELQQIGTPRQIYDRPSNFFVSRFIGDINALPGKIIGTDAGLAEIRSAAGVIRLPTEGVVGPSRSAGTDCMICFRLEDVLVGPAAQGQSSAVNLSARVVDILPLGAVTRVSFATGDETITSLMMTHDLDRRVPSVGSECQLAIAGDKVHVFTARV